MKYVLAAVLLAVSVCASAHTYHDMLDTYSQYGHQSFIGHVTVLDTEDSIKQVEINDATWTWTGNDLIFYSGFEQYNVNWIWTGDDTTGAEFGYVGQCSHYSAFKDGDDQHVALYGCFLIYNEAQRP